MKSISFSSQFLHFPATSFESVFSNLVISPVSTSIFGSSIIDRDVTSFSIISEILSFFFFSIFFSFFFICLNSFSFSCFYRIASSLTFYYAALYFFCNSGMFYIVEGSKHNHFFRQQMHKGVKIRQSRISRGITIEATMAPVSSGSVTGGNDS